MFEFIELYIYKVRAKKFMRKIEEKGVNFTVKKLPFCLLKFTGLIRWLDGSNYLSPRSAHFT